MVFALSHVCVYSHYGDIHSFSIENFFIEIHFYVLLPHFRWAIMRWHSFLMQQNKTKKSEKISKQKSEMQWEKRAPQKYQFQMRINWYFIFRSIAFYSFVPYNVLIGEKVSLGSLVAFDIHWTNNRLNTSFVSARNWLKTANAFQRRKKNQMKWFFLRRTLMPNRSLKMRYNGATFTTER